MTPRVLSVGDAEATTLARAGLGLPPMAPRSSGGPGPPPQTDVLDQMTVWAAALRAALWAQTNGGAAPVHTTRLLNQARQLAEPALGTTHRLHLADDGPSCAEHRRVTLRNVLDEIHALGDVAGLPGGYWLPAPTRLVPLQRVTCCLLVGGLPTTWLPPEVRQGLEHAGPSRLRGTHQGASSSGLPVQSEAAWLRAPDTDVARWARQVLHDMPLDLPSGDLMDQGVELYRPDRARPAEWQHSRWRRLEPGGLVSQGRFLGRMATRAGRRYLVLALAGRRILQAASLPAETLDLRRLLYGLDALASRPTRVTRHAASVSVGYELRSELPSVELRLLRALGGTLTVPPDGDYYPRCWTVRSGLAPRIDHALANLGVDIAHHDR
jgi:hypothetical protein